MSGAISAKRRWTTPLSRTTVMTRRRACRSPRLAKVMRRSASGRRRLAFASVVVMRSCTNSALARFASINRSCAGLPPKREPLVGVGICTPLELFGLGEVRVATVEVIVSVGLNAARQLESGRAVLERQAETGELDLHLVDRLRTEVADVEQVGL